MGFCSPPCAGARLQEHFHGILFSAMCWSTAAEAFSWDFALCHVLSVQGIVTKHQLVPATWPNHTETRNQVKAWRKAYARLS